MKFETLKEQHAKRNPEDLEIDYEDLIKLNTQDIVPYEEVDSITYDSDVMETETLEDGEVGEDEQGESALANLGGGWGRNVFSPIRRGKHLSMDICRSTNRDASEGSFERVIVTQSKNPTLHHQARRF